MALVACESNPEQGSAERDLDPGRVGVHRLNRAEYDATVRDLLGTRLAPAQSFPVDNSSQGFDNIAEALSLSPLHLELYERAASDVLTDVLGQRIPEAIDWSWAEAADIAWSAPYLGRYDLTIQPEDQAFPVAVTIDDETYTTLVSTDPVQISVHLEPGPHQIKAGLSSLELAGPFEVDWQWPESRSTLLLCEPPEGDAATCARETLKSFVPRAWRRPVSARELDGLMGLYELTIAQGGDFDEAVRNALLATLVSPNFLFRVQLDHEEEAGVRSLTGYELASRLSYFLWSSMPDEELFLLADSGELLQEEVLLGQVQRMLEDERATALVDNFAGQWLMIRAMDDVFPDYAVYPGWDGALASSMREEMRLYAKTILLSDRSMRDLLTSQEAFVDGRLAAHYGMSDIPDEFGIVRVDSTGHPRAGFITTAGLLTALSYPTRTSPVKRGKWVMTNLLCETPPPPPPEVEGLQTEDREDLTVREQMELHRADPACASCHEVMDPIGFSFENYDGIGAYREVDELGFPINASGRLPDGTGFQDVRDLMRPVSFSPKFSQCVAQKTLTYALGRKLSVEDVASLEQIVERFESDDLRFVDLVKGVVLSPPFRTRSVAP